MKEKYLREDILKLIEKYADKSYDRSIFIKGESTVPPSGKVIDAEELKMMTEAVLDGWLTTGRFNKEFEKK